MTGSPIVVDASIVLRWLLPDPLSEACWRLFEVIAEAENQITAPTLLVYEVISGLTKAVLFGSLSTEEAHKAMRQFFALEPQLAEANEVLSRHAIEWTFRLERVAAYDSYYIALAEALDCKFWTADKRLFHTAREAQLDLVFLVGESLGNE